MHFRILTILILSLAISDCKTLMNNNVQELALACGVDARNASKDLLFKVAPTGSIIEKQDLQVFGETLNGEVVPIEFSITQRSCVEIEKSEIINYDKPISIVLKARSAGKIILGENSREITTVKMEACDPFCKAFPSCGSIRVSDNLKPDNFTVFKIQGIVGSRINASIENDSLNSALNVNDNNCFYLNEGHAGILKISDNNGKFLDKSVDEIMRSKKGGAVEIVQLREPLNFEEKKCKENPSAYKMADGKCVSKNFKDFCLDEDGNPGVSLLGSFYVKFDCASIDDSLKKKSKIEFKSKGLINVEVFSGIESLKEIDLSLNPFTTLQNLINLPALEVLRINYLKYPFDASSLNQYRSLKILTTSGTQLKLVSKMDINENIEEIESDQTDKEFLSKFPNLKSLKIVFDKKLNLSNLASLSKLEYLELSGIDPISNLAALANLKNLKELVFMNSKISDGEILPELRNLERIYFTDTKFPVLTSLEQSKNLETLGLDISDPGGSFGLPSNLSVKDLSVTSHEKMKWDWLASFPNLESLSFSGDFDDLISSPRIATLKILNANGQQLDTLEGLKNFPNLEELYLYDVGSALDLSTLPLLPRVHTFWYGTEDDSKEFNWKWVPKIPELRDLTLYIKPSNSVTESEFPKNLNSLYLKSTTITNFDFLRRMEKLETLTLSINNTEKMIESHDFDLPKIKSVRLVINPNQFFSIPTFSGVEKGGIILINGFDPVDPGIFSHPNRNPFPNLRELSFDDESHGLKLLSHFQKIERLDLETTGEDLLSLPALNSVTDLKLKAPVLNNFEEIEKLANLENIEMSFGREVKSLAPFKKLRKLKKLQDNSSLRENFPDDETCPISMDSPEGLRNYCLDYQMNFLTSFGPSPF